MKKPAPSLLPAPAEVREAIKNLVDKFSRNLESYQGQDYKEGELRIEFINPFFDALGWDVENKDGAAEQYKKVIHGYALRVGLTTKEPDYAFRIGGARKFFLEAKKPSVALKDNPDPAYQLRLYGWNAKLPISLLTNFMELAIYDCRGKPSAKDKAGAARIAYYTFSEYLARLDEIYSRFSYAAMEKGNFDRYAESKKPRAVQPVDEAFLEDIEGWRKKLAQNISLRNQRLTVYDINYAVQVIIDRIIFLRIAEDRGIEPAEKLHASTNGANIYRRLLELFYECDDKYNSGLFDFKTEKADRLTPQLKIDDQILQEIIASLYDDCPYIFKEFTSDILGSIYERFLGKVIRLTAGHQAKVEDKPEVKKAGGVYYTPKYIVDYIVENTVGRLIDCSRDTLVPDSVSGRDTPVPHLKGIGNSLLVRQFNLPHWQIGGSTYFVSFRCSRGSLPEPALRQVMENIRYDEGRKFDLYLAVVMPDHVHMMIKPKEIRPGIWYDLAEIMKGIKGVSARRINQMFGTEGEVWQNECFDHIVRDEEEFQQKLQYMLNNPVKACLVKDPNEYEFFIQPTLVVRDRSVPPTSLTPKQISEIKILDPACGSGSFLLSAYQHLLDYHLKWYSQNQPEKRQKEIYQGLGGQWFFEVPPIGWTTFCPIYVRSFACEGIVV